MFSRNPVLAQNHNRTICNICSAKNWRNKRGSWPGYRNAPYRPRNFKFFRHVGSIISHAILILPGKVISFFFCILSIKRISIPDTVPSLYIYFITILLYIIDQRLSLGFNEFWQTDPKPCHPSFKTFRKSILFFININWLTFWKDIIMFILILIYYVLI